MRVSANGGEPEVLTKPDTGQPGTSHQFPSVLPGGRGRALPRSRPKAAGGTRIAAPGSPVREVEMLLEGGKSGGEYAVVPRVPGRTSPATRCTPCRSISTSAGTHGRGRSARGRRRRRQGRCRGAAVRHLARGHTRLRARVCSPGPAGIPRMGRSRRRRSIDCRRARAAGTLPLRLSPSDDCVALDVREGHVRHVGLQLSAPHPREGDGQPAQRRLSGLDTGRAEDCQQAPARAWSGVPPTAAALRRR